MGVAIVEHEQSNNEGDYKMTGHADSKMQKAGAGRSTRTAHEDDRKYRILGMEQLKLVKLIIGKEGKASCHFSPRIDSLPKEFLILPEIEWRSAEDKDISDELRRYIAARREEGETVELSVADTGVVRIDLTIRGVNRSLWFNVGTSDTVVLDAYGNVCRNIRETLQDCSE